MKHTKEVSGTAYRYNWDEPPKPGTRFVDSFGDTVVFDEIGAAGMLYCTVESTGFQNAYEPHELRPA